MAKTNAQDWFRENAKRAVDYRNNLVNNTDRLRSTMAIGKMYFFFYDPKHKDKLPVYDRFPLVFPIERYDDGFLCLNLHFLSVPQRKSLLDELMRYSNNKNLTPRTKLLLSYDVLQRTRTLNSLSRPCIKRYLNTQFRSRFVEIMPDEWYNVLDLPTADFVTKS